MDYKEKSKYAEPDGPTYTFYFVQIKKFLKGL
jgi:hypothetical protein